MQHVFATSTRCPQTVLAPAVAAFDDLFESILALNPEPSSLPSSLPA